MNRYPAPRSPDPTPRAHYARQWGALKRERDLYRPTWEEIADYIIPFVGMDYENQSPGGRAERRPRRSKRSPLLINNKATLASRTLINGLASGLTSPSRPWLKFTVEGLRDDEDASAWLQAATRAVLWLAGHSNYHTATKMQYRDLVLFGTGVKIIDEHPEHDVNCVPLPVGSYCLGLGEDGRPNMVMRETHMTVGQLIERFGYGRCSLKVRDQYDRGDYHTSHRVCQTIEPNRLYQKGKYGLLGMAYSSVYYEMACSDDHNELLSVKGYRGQPFSAARWDYMADDTYGNSVATETLGDIKALQVLEHRKAQAVDKQVTPPTQGPPSLVGNRISHMPGAFTSNPDPSSSIRPLYDVRPDMNAISFEINRHEERIDAAFFVDVLMTATSLERHNVKAEEIVERREEKMMAFSPLLENLYTELLDVDAGRMLAIAIELGLIPPPPPSLQEQPFKLKYTSTLAQMQASFQVAPIERLFTFAGGLVGVYPEARDKLDADEAIEAYAEAIGAPTGLLVGRQVLEETRAARMQQQQQAQAMEQTSAGAAAAKTLSEAEMSDPNLLSFLVGQ